MLRRLTPALVAPLLIIAACATEAGDAAVEVRTGPEAVLALRAAPEAVTDAGTAAFEMTMAMEVAGESIDLSATGAYDAANERAAIEVDMGSVFEGLAGAGEALPEGFDEPMEMVLDGTTIYLRAPMFATAGGSEWLSLTPEELGASADALGLGAGAYDPSTVLDSLRGVSGEPEAVGTEVVRGVETTHYVATVDLADALAELPEDQRALTEAQLDQLGDGAIAVDVWVDAEGLPRRLVMDMGDVFGSMGLGAEMSAVMTMEFFDYGVPVDIEVPAPDQVQPMTDLLGGPEGLDEAS